MKGLLIDTTGANLEIAYADGERNDYIFKGGLKHSLTLLPALEELLTRNFVSINDIDVFGAVTGPGSFTGIRIGISTVKAMAYALKKPVIAVNSMRVRAYNIYDGIVIAIRDAANGYAYIGAYEQSAELLSPKCLTVKELESFLADNSDGEIVTGYPFCDGCNKDGLLRALREAMDGDLTSGGVLEPLYIRKPQAEM